MNNENKHIEYKREFIDDIAKEVIALANTDGGEIYVGVNDDGTPAPLENTDDTYTKHHLKFGKNQADNLVAVFNRFILDFGADFFLYFIGV